MQVKTKRRALKASCVLTLIAMALMTWSILQPNPLSVMVAMTLGQVIGTLSLAIFLWVAVLVDLRR